MYFYGFNILSSAICDYVKDNFLHFSKSNYETLMLFDAFSIEKCCLNSAKVDEAEIKRHSQALQPFVAKLHPKPEPDNLLENIEATTSLFITRHPFAR